MNSARLINKNNYIGMHIIIFWPQSVPTAGETNFGENWGSGNGILLPKLFWHTVRKNCSSDREKLLKFEAEGRELAKFLRSLEQFMQTVKGQNNFW